MNFKPGTPVVCKPGAERSHVSREFDLVAGRIYIIAESPIWTFKSESVRLVEGRMASYSVARFMLPTNLTKLERAIYEGDLE